jgi:glycosyltransferase involved in cell wall biosynthesis
LKGSYVRKKVFFVVNSLAVGGAEKQTVQLINALAPDVFEPVLCYFEPFEALKGELAQGGRLGGLYHLGRKGRFDLNILKRLASLIREVRPAIVVSVNLYPSLYTHLARIFCSHRFALIQVMHTTIIPDRYTQFLVWVLFRHLANRSDQVVFVCKNQMEHWIKRHGIRRDISRYIYNGIDTDYFGLQPSPEEKKRLRERLGISDSETVLAICANLGPQKRHPHLIQAGKMLLDKGFPVKVLIIGDGRERGNIERYAEESGMGDRVIITGLQHDVRPFLSLADVVVMTSTAIETFSLAVLEAMALGKAVVASNIGGASEQVIPGLNGFLFPPGDVGSLAAHLEKIISDNLFEAMGRESRELVGERFTAGRMVEEYSRLFLEEGKIRAG